MIKLLVPLLCCILGISMELKAQIFDTLIDSRDGKIYQTVTIGSQIWMAENLAFKPYKNYWVYNDLEINLELFGYLYNWETSRKVCPSGWHLPSDPDWSKLTDYLGGLDSSGIKMKNTSGWNNSGNGTNKSGFTGIAGGSRNGGNGLYDYIGVYASWWTSTQSNTSNAWFRFLYYQNGKVYRSYSDKVNGLYVRCLKD